MGAGVGTVVGTGAAAGSLGVVAPGHSPPGCPGASHRPRQDCLALRLSYWLVAGDKLKSVQEN